MTDLIGTGDFELAPDTKNFAETDCYPRIGISPTYKVSIAPADVLTDSDSIGRREQLLVGLFAKFFEAQPQLFWFRS